MITIKELSIYFQNLKTIKNTPFYRAIDNGPYISTDKDTLENHGAFNITDKLELITSIQHTSNNRKKH